MGRRIIITMTAHRRPYYFEQAVKSIEEAYCSSYSTILVSVDGGYPIAQQEIVNVAKASKLNFDIITHNEILGCAGNTGFVLREGFNRADRVVHLEEDIIISKRFLLYMEQMLDHFEDNKDIFSISGFSHNKKPDLKLINKVEVIKRFRCVGWGMWKDRFEDIDEWFGISWKPDRPFTDANVPEGEEFLKWINKTAYGSWGWAMDMYHRRGRSSIAPFVSKSRHIGQLDGTFCKGNEKIEPMWAGNVKKLEGEIML